MLRRVPSREYEALLSILGRFHESRATPSLGSCVQCLCSHPKQVSTFGFQFLPDGFRKNLANQKAADVELLSGIVTLEDALDHFRERAIAPEAVGLVAAHQAFR